ncbi:MAG: ABC transporter permease [Clostridia bacterium]|nr:ABC transporter permease [Clostridia bacterium]
MKTRKTVTTVAFNVAAVLIGLIICALLLFFMKVDPGAVISKTMSKIIGDKYNMGEVLVKATPLILTSLAFAFTYQANLFNIGAQGQFYMGCIAAVSISLALGGKIPTLALILIVLVASFAAGAATGSFIGFAKSRFGANEFLVSMMSTYVVSAFMDYLLRTSLQETKAEYLQTDGIAKAAYLPKLIKGTRVHWGFIIAVAAAVLIWILLNKTGLGFRIRAVGMNHHAAELGGIRTGKVYVIAFAIAGGLAGLAGLTEINGVQHMLLRDFNASIGSYGIGIAILANGNPIGCIFASILFGFLNVVGTTMGRLPNTSIPASIIDLLEGIVMTCVIASYAARHAYEVHLEKKRTRKESV